MKKKKTERQKVHRIIVNGLRETIRIHGPITKLFIGSAAKRIVSTIISKEKKDDCLSSNAK